MKNNKRRPILYKGEEYSSPVTKRRGGTTKEPVISFDNARNKIIHDIDLTTEQIKSIPRLKRMPHELILCVRMHPDFSAKSYYPQSLFDENTTSDNIEEIGSRIWRNKNSDVENKPEEFGKLFFVRTTENGLSNFRQRLNKRESTYNKNFMLDIRRLSQIDLLSAKEQILGFDAEWREGRIEAVIHPFNIDNENAFKLFKSIAVDAGADLNSLKHKQYGGGITFVSLMADLNIVKALTGYNPLRTMHPMRSRELPLINRGTPMKGLPLAPTFNKVSPIKIGIIDGGFKVGNPYLDKYVEVIQSVPGLPYDEGVEHGTHVTSAALYGPLNDYKNSDQLSEPSVSVKNFRVLSQNIYSDPDLYEAIDAIEIIVPNNKDISVYNLSFGPKGPILDDHISRFTFACDKLSYDHNVLFCVAVGNDGEVIGYDRIQSPADLVNGLAVGAFTINNGTKERAAYSCKGPGREGNKLKPDVMAFGGCERVPIQLVSSITGHRAYTLGTSFASPITTAASAQLIGGSKSIIHSLVARALIVHSAVSNQSHNGEMGHGTLPDNLSDIIICPDKSYTLIFNGEIDPTKYVQYSIPWVEGINKGIVKFRWTTAVLCNVDPLSPDDYTASSIETSFYPNSKKFVFSFGKMQKKTCLVDIEAEPEKAKELIDSGWTKSEFPAPKSGPIPFAAEQDLKSDLKWDSIDQRDKNIRANDIKAPMFHVHAFNRGHRNRNSKVKFAIILTVEAPKAEIDLYSKIIAKFPALVALKVDIKTSVPIKVGT